MSNPNNELAKAQEMNAPAQLPANPPPSASQRFTNLVIREFATNAPQGAIQLNDQQRRLVQGYFVIIDRALKTAEETRLRKNSNNSNHRYDNLIPYDWQHVNMTDLALDAVHYARMGLDMQEKNHLFPIPYANKKAERYDITFQVGYSGIQYIAEKYATTTPKSVTIEVVYANDVFKALKKSKTNPIDTYEFEIVNAFDRGAIVGGFGYIEHDEPSRNELVIMNMSDIKKRAGKNANAEFWGTEFTGKQVQVWNNGQKELTDAEGWLDEMCRKTLIREVFSGKHIPRDPSKIDDSYQYLREREVVYAEYETEQDALDNANRIPIDTPPASPPMITDGDAPPESTPKPSEPVVKDGAVQDPDF